MWVVKLTSTPVQNDFRIGFFPRKFYYKSDAERLVQEVKRKGGDAVIEKEKSNA